MILGGFNAKIGKGRMESVVGDFLGDRDEKEKRLIQ